jgi:hypothetical protein
MPIDVPPGFRTGLLTEPTSQRTVRLYLVKDGMPVPNAVFEVGGELLGRIAAMLLGEAQKVSPYSGSMAPPSVGVSVPPETIVSVTSVGLSEHQDPTLSTLIVRVGEASLGFAVPTESLGELGRSLQAASAVGHQH